MNLVHDDHIVTLYENLSASISRVVRRRRSLSASPIVPGSPVVSARTVSRRTGISIRSQEGTSSMTRPPGFSNTTPIHNAVHSPVSVLRFPMGDGNPGLGDAAVDLGYSSSEPDEEEDPDEDPPEEVPEHLPNGFNGEAMVQDDNVIIPNAENDDLPEPPQNQVFGQQLFDGIDDEGLIQMIKDSGFTLPDNVEAQEDIISRIRQLDNP